MASNTIPASKLDASEPPRPNEHSIWTLANGNMSSVVMRTAIRLATEMMFKNDSDEMKRIFLNYNVENSQVDLVDQEMIHHIIELSNDPTPMKPKDIQGFLEEDYTCYDAYLKRNLLYIHPELVEYCQRITEKTPGFHRAVFFIAITLLHETTCWNFKNNRGEEKHDEPLKESGQHFEIMFNKGILQLEFNSDSHFKNGSDPEIMLKLILEEKMDVLTSPEVQKFYINRHKQQQQQKQTPIATIQSVLIEQTPTTAFESRTRVLHKFVDVTVEYNNLEDVKIQIRNDTDEDIFLPIEYSARYFEFQLTKFTTNESADKRRLCSKKNTSIKKGTPFLTIKPKETHNYYTDVKSLISSFKNIDNAIYVLQLRLKISSCSAFPHPQSLYSNWSSMVLRLRPEDLEEEDCTNKYPQTTILGRVQSPYSFVYLLKKDF